MNEINQFAQLVSGWGLVVVAACLLRAAYMIATPGRLR